MAQGVPGRLRPRIFLTFRHYKVGRSSVKRTGRFYPRRNPWYSLSEAESTSGHMVLSGVPRKKKSPVTPPGIDPGTVQWEITTNRQTDEGLSVDKEFRLGQHQSSSETADLWAIRISGTAEGSVTCAWMSRGRKKASSDYRTRHCCVNRASEQ